MFPATLTVSPNTVVTFQMSKDSFETHTATFGPKPELAKLAKGFQGVNFPAQGVFPSDPPGTITESQTAHGDGFANTGTLDSNPHSRRRSRHRGRSTSPKPVRTTSSV